MPGFEGGFDLVLLSDLVYDPAALGPLVETLAMLLGSADGGGGGSGGPAAAEANGGPPHAGAGGDAGGGGGGPTALVAVELRADTGVAQFVRALVQRGYFVARVRAGAQSRGGRAGGRPAGALSAPRCLRGSVRVEFMHGRRTGRFEPGSGCPLAILATLGRPHPPSLL